MFRDFIPKSYTYLRSGYSFSSFKKDFLAGVTVGIIALPLAMAFAIASGTTPERGLFTAIIAGFLISALGGSRIQIGGAYRRLCRHRLRYHAKNWIRRISDLNSHRSAPSRSSWTFSGRLLD